jgi:hypothetical protein
MKYHSFLVKILAICLVVIYLSPPLQGPTKYILHSVSHFLKVPEQIITHDHHGANYLVPLHRKHKLAEADADHLHEIIDMLSDVFSSETQKEQLPAPDLLDLDKHFVFKIQQTSAQSVSLKTDPKVHDNMLTRIGFLPALWKPPLY